MHDSSCEFGRLNYHSRNAPKHNICNCIVTIMPPIGKISLSEKVLNLLMLLNRCCLNVQLSENLSRIIVGEEGKVQNIALVLYSVTVSL